MINQISQVTKFSPLKKLPAFWVPVLILLVAGGLVALVIFVTLGYQIAYLDKGYAGVSVAGIDVSGMSRQKIIDAVNTQAAEYLSKPITIKAGSDESWTFTGQQLGLRVDVVATADKAYQIGRTGNLLTDLFTQLSLFFTPQDVEPVILYDSDSANAVLQQLTDVVNYPPQNAALVIHSASDIEVIPAQRGRRLHVGATQPLIEAAIFSRDTQPVVNAFTQEVIPAITDEQINGLYQQVQKLVSEPLVFGFTTGTDAGEWRLTPDEVTPMINIVQKVDTAGDPRFTLELDKQKLAPYLEEFARVINIEPSDARLKFDEEAGKLIVVQHSRDGRTLNVESTYEQVAAVVAIGDHFVDLPVELAAPAVSSENLDSLGIKALVSESTSYFKGSSQGRMNNIALAASKFDGVVVPPGAIFSFNEHLGPVTAEEGYDESLIIYGDRTTVGIGGGVCQVSTTAFRAAFFGGFELVERWAHGYRVGWYETNSVPGLDATVYTPDVDLRFRNDTENYLLIHTQTDKENGTLTFKFFGTPTGREVLVSEPVQSNLVKHGPPVFEETSTLPQGIMKQVDWAKDGMDVSVTRVVKQGDTVIHKDEIISHYRPWRAVYQVGTGS